LYTINSKIRSMTMTGDHTNTRLFVCKVRQQVKGARLARVRRTGPKSQVKSQQSTASVAVFIAMCAVIVRS